MKTLILEKNYKLKKGYVICDKETDLYAWKESNRTYWDLENQPLYSLIERKL